MGVLQEMLVSYIKEVNTSISGEENPKEDTGQGEAIAGLASVPHQQDKTVNNQNVQAKSACSNIPGINKRLLLLHIYLTNLMPNSLVATLEIYKEGNSGKHGSFMLPRQGTISTWHPLNHI